MRAMAATSEDGHIFSEMLGYSLERLNKEPELLHADSDRVRRQMTELAVSQYGAFLSAAACTSAVRTEVSGIKQHLEALQLARPARHVCTSGNNIHAAVQGLPKLSAGCTNFAKAAERIAALRAQNRQLLQQHGCAPGARFRAERSPELAS